MRNLRKDKVRALQRKLYRAAKQSLGRRFGALYDKMYREDILEEAWYRVRANHGAPGVDEQSFEIIEEEIGVEAFLAELGQALREQSYRPLPARRCWIDKPGKAEKRPLGIPVIRDRVCQMAAKLVIEPIFEANFLPCSYGFRPQRSAHGAIRKIREEITFRGQSTVIDADIRGCFDNIRHDLLMSLAQRRISDPRLLKLLRAWLRAGVLDHGEYIATNEVGTPQGGVISPLLSNVYLHAFDQMFRLSGIAGTLVRYADDFVILLRGNGQQVLERVRQMMARLGLELHPDKTRVVRADEGFDFLGVHFRRRPVRKPNAKLAHTCHTWPSDRSIKRIRQRVKEVIGRRYSLSLEALIAQLNPVLRGWGNYHRPVAVSRQRLRKLDGYVRERFRIFLKRKYSDQSRGTRRLPDNLLVRLGLYQLG
jgi:group II intron reverse transcriptase/maturase